MKKVFLFLFFIAHSSLFSQEINCKCCDKSHSEFDFWVGSWVVTNLDKSIAGYNTIEKIQDNCILKEDWKSIKGNYSGTSYNYFNKNNKKWEQLWIDNQGEVLKLRDERIENKMILKSDALIDEEGISYFHRITWTYNPDETVRQLWEIIKENTNIYWF